MNKSDLQKLIRAEVVSVVRSELPKIVKPLVQEAVAGALANLIAEGIVKGAPKQVVQPNKVPLRPNVSVPEKKSFSPMERRKLAEQIGYASPPRSEVQFSTNNSVIDNILSETAMDMSGQQSTESVLDTIGSLNGVIDQDAVDAITRDYSDLMAAMNKKR